jgi:hypothetical protein
MMVGQSRSRRLVDAGTLVGLLAMRTRNPTRHCGAARLSMDCFAPLTRAIRRSRFARVAEGRQHTTSGTRARTGSISRSIST